MAAALRAADMHGLVAAHTSKAGGDCDVVRSRPSSPQLLSICNLCPWPALARSYFEAFLSGGGHAPNAKNLPANNTAYAPSHRWVIIGGSEFLLPVPASDVCPIAYGASRRACHRRLGSCRPLLCLHSRSFLLLPCCALLLLPVSYC